MLFEIKKIIGRVQRSRNTEGISRKSHENGQSVGNSLGDTHVRLAKDSFEWK